MKASLSRRAALAGMGGLALSAPFSTAWAATGARWLASAKTGDEAYALLALREDGAEAFRLDLPARGHAAAAHPFEPVAVAFARRPGDFAMILNCEEGRETGRLQSPAGRHFYGHGVFSADGKRLFTTENDYESGEGRISVWDAEHGFERLGEFSSGGVGPHDVKLSADGASLIVANGGIRTHPAAGRAKLNIPDMRPNIAFLSVADGALTQLVEPEESMRLNSLRHLALSGDDVLIGAQWEGDRAETPPLVARLRVGEGLSWARAERREWAQMRAYAGSIAMSGAGGSFVVTSPRGGVVLIFDAKNLALLRLLKIPDASGAAPAPAGFAVTSGEGRSFLLSGGGDIRLRAAHSTAFDNHLIAL